ncbi:2-octaprenyl-3-methyl-6-methoxy-1,4-benzoquinol hydroxylase [Lacimicrobium alkaliphilum]|uniref:2-octaprenyl-3-methyl-6-methoxy-1,4-benzoquinol hydroxylase n=2 Tax=Lacimicrobium alkaliphilum TaxID=1526571 RepID=A0A0U2RSJ4_9ALTE|nr:2-octaprenyl-3-methyl-6-methoxy-1,4-benzoquinol hydroxylase [Lacimicrobium alkaliphilum]
MQKFDVMVIGGSMTGAAMALGLARQNYSVAVVEPHMPAPFAADSVPDIRVSAISAASRTLLEQLGAWQSLEAMRVCPYRRLSVWEDGARTDFTAEDIPARQLGHIIENSLIQRALYEVLQQSSRVKWFNAGLDCFVEQNTNNVILTDGSEISAALLIGADGGHSKVRQQLGIGICGWQYKQQALAVSVKTHAPQQDITWQQFVPSGPMAFLPLYDGYASLVWYHQAEQIQWLKALSDSDLKTEIKQAFPAELMDFDILSRASFPLSRQHASEYVTNNAVLIGDAAHTINPLAGQGLNLGFKDVACLMTELEDKSWLDSAHQLGQALTRYERKRRPDNLLMMSAMDVIYKTFSTEILPVTQLRRLGLRLAQHAGPLKKQVTRYAMGI